MSADILEPKPAAPRRRVHGKREREERRDVDDDCDEKRRIQINIFSFTLLAAAAAEEAESNCACGASERASPSSATETVSTKSIIRHEKTSSLVATRRRTTSRLLLPWSVLRGGGSPTYSGYMVEKTHVLKIGSKFIRAKFRTNLGYVSFNNYITTVRGWTNHAQSGRPLPYPARISSVR